MDRRGILAFVVLLGALGFWLSASPPAHAEGAEVCTAQSTEASALKSWMQEQIAAGRTRFVADDPVRLCAR